MRKTYVTGQESSPIERIDRYHSDRQNHLCVELKEGSEAEPVLKALKEAGYSVRYTDKNSIVSVAFVEEKKAFEQLQKVLGEKLQTASKGKTKKRTDWMKIRGIFGTLGQGAMLAAARDENNSGLKTSTFISLGANGLTWFYGDQKKADTQRMEQLYQETGKIIREKNPDYQPLLTQSLTREATRGNEAQQLNRFMQANNTRVTEAAKVVAKANLLFNGDNTIEKIMGGTQLSAKFFSIFAFEKSTVKTEKPPSLLRRFMERGNTWAGILEFTAQFVNLAQSLYTPFIYGKSYQGVDDVLRKRKKAIVGYSKDGKKTPIRKDGAKGLVGLYKKRGEIFSRKNISENLFSRETQIISKWRFAGTMLFFAGFIAKMFAPTTVKKIDWEEVQQHAAIAVSQLPEAERVETLALLAQRYHALAEEKEKRPNEILSGMLEKLYQAQPQNNKEQTAEKDAMSPEPEQRREAENKQHAKKVGARHHNYTENLGKEALASAQSNSL
jgi:lysophospholipase L1-like esterase